jgi:hypothetical protein
MPLPKWVICGSTGTLTSDGKTTTVRWFDPKQAAPLQVVDGAAKDRKYGNEDKLPWREKILEMGSRPAGAFYDNVIGVLRRGEAMVVTPASVRETYRVMELIRKKAGTKKELLQVEQNNGQ